ncbi:major facilitator superfamily domain-containing protein [Aspergillus oleicola]
MVDFLVTLEEEKKKKVVRKLDMVYVLIPLMGICYIMQYMDKLALTQATLFGLREDIGLVNSQYSWASPVFYFGYFAWSWTSSYLMVQLPLANYLSICGGVLIFHAAAKNFGGIMAACFFLGVREATAWFFGNCISNLISGMLLFLSLGTVTTAIGFFILAILPDAPQKTIFLNQRERTIAHQGIYNEQGRIIINGFGFDPLRSLLMQMPLGAAQIVFLLITTSVTSFIPNTRVLMMIINTTAAMVGIILVWQLDQDDQKGRLTGLALAAVFAVNIPLSLSIITSNVAGFTKRSTTSGLLFVAYYLGNIIGPQLFFKREEPNYNLIGRKDRDDGSVAGLALGVFFLVCLLVYYSWENKRRKKFGVPTDATEVEAIAQGLSDKTDLEITSFRYIL